MLGDEEGLTAWHHLIHDGEAFEPEFTCEHLLHVTPR
jgi:hypothetical protein